MSARTGAAIAIVLGFACGGCSGCDHGHGQSTGSASVARDDGPPPKAPLPTNAKASAKANEVYRLLAGGRTAKSLPERSVDDGASFDRDLEDKVAPSASAR